LYGSKCRGASRRKGDGPLAGAKHKEYQEAQSKYLTLQGQLDTAIAERGTAETQQGKDQAGRLQEAKDQANKELPGLRRRHAALVEFIDARNADDTGAIKKDTGLLAQVRALSRVGDQDHTLRWAHLFVFLLFFLIEILPVSAKVLMNLGSPSAYDLAAGLKE